MNPLDLRFPLDEEYLPTLMVDTSTIAAWTRAAKAEIANVVQNRTSWFYRGDELSRSFKLIYEKESLRGFARSASSAEKKDFLCQGHIQLSLDDIAYGLYSETTFELRSVQVQLYQETFLDAAVLHVSERQTPDDPFHFAGVKWVAYSSPSPGLVAPRDFVYFEYSCKTTDADGRPVIVQYLECPELLRHQIQEHDMGLTRGTMLMINTFRTEPDGSTYCQSAGTFEAGKWSTSKSLPQSFKSMLNLVGLADARAIVNLGVLKTLPARQESSDKKTCSVCAKKFNMLTRTRQICRSCGRCTCRKCIVGLKFFNENSLYSSTLPVVSEKFCFKCVMNSREQRRDGGSLSLCYSSGTVGSGSPSIASRSTNSSTCIDEPEMWNAIDKMDNLSMSDSAAAAAAAAARRSSNQSESSNVSAEAPGSGSSAKKHSKTPSISLIDEEATRQVMGEQQQRRAAARSSAAHSSSSASSPVGMRSNSVYSAMPVSVATGTLLSPVGSGNGPSDAFAKMSEAIAAQNALLMNIQHERQKMHSVSGKKPSYGYAQYVASPPISPCGGSSFTADDDRFEIISD